jgi:1-acyl-sn-glycerol-3-phosphate acyltransferase
MTRHLLTQRKPAERSLRGAALRLKAIVIPFPLRQVKAEPRAPGTDQPVRESMAVLRQIRAAWRLTLVLLHILWGCLIVATTFPRRSLASQRRAKRDWSRQILGHLGVRLKVQGKVPAGGVLVVANHVSWLDIYAINAVRPCAFVCKEEVRRWPVLGWLTARSESVFIQRGSRRAAHRTAEALTDALRAKAAIVVFPEGTTTDGSHMLPFRPALLQSAVDAEVPVVPVALRYRDARHAISPAAAYDGDITIWQCLRAIALADQLVAEVTVLPAIDARHERAHLAAHAKHEIATALGIAHQVHETHATLDEN